MTQEEMETFLQKKGIPNATNWIYGLPLPISFGDWWIFSQEVQWIESTFQETGYYAFVASPSQLNAADRDALVLLSNPASRAEAKE